MILSCFFSVIMGFPWFCVSTASLDPPGFCLLSRSINHLHLTVTGLSWVSWSYCISALTDWLWFFLACGLADLAVLPFNHGHSWLFSSTTTSKSYSAIFNLWSLFYYSSALWSSSFTTHLPWDSTSISQSIHITLITIHQPPVAAAIDHCSAVHNTMSTHCHIFYSVLQNVILHNDTLIIHPPRILSSRNSNLQNIAAHASLEIPCQFSVILHAARASQILSINSFTVTRHSSGIPRTQVGKKMGYMKLVVDGLAIWEHGYCQRGRWLLLKHPYVTVYTSALWIFHSPVCSCIYSSFLP